MIQAVPMQIDMEDFRTVTESYGMQLDDDIILATFSKVCPLQFCSSLMGFTCKHTSPCFATQIGTVASPSIRCKCLSAQIQHRNEPQAACAV